MAPELTEMFRSALHGAAYFRVKDNPDRRSCSITLYGDGDMVLGAQSGRTEAQLDADMVVERCAQGAPRSFFVRGEQHYRWDGEVLHRADEAQS